MPPDIPAWLLGTAGPGALLAATVYMVLTGRLVTRQAHMDRIADKDAQIAYLQAADAVRVEQVRVRDEQISKLLPQSDLTVQLLQGLTREARHAAPPT